MGYNKKDGLIFLSKQNFVTLTTTKERKHSKVKDLIIFSHYFVTDNGKHKIKAAKRRVNIDLWNDILSLRTTPVLGRSCMFTATKIIFSDPP